MREFFAQQLQRHAVLDRDRDSQRKTVHQSADRRSLFRHFDKELARASIGIETHGDIALVSAHVELVRHRHALLRQPVPHRPRRTVQILFDHRGHRGFLRACRLRSRRAQRLRFLAPIAIDSHGLQAQLPGLKIGFHDLFDRGRLRQIDRLRNRPRDERLRRRHHPQVSHVMNAACSLSRFERAIKHRQMLIFHVRRALNRSRRVNVTDNRIRLIMIVPKLEQRRRHRLIDNLYHPSAHQLLELD